MKREHLDYEEKLSVLISHGIPKFDAIHYLEVLDDYPISYLKNLSEALKEIAKGKKTS